MTMAIVSLQLPYRARWSLSLCCWIVAGSLIALASQGAPAAESPIFPEELFSRIHRTSVAEFRNAVGYYVVRNIDSKRPQKNKDTIESLERSLDERLKARVENDKKYGVATDIKKLKAEHQAIIAAAKSKYQGDVTTQIERYAIEGGKFGVERIPVSNNDPLEKIRQDVLARQIDLSRPTVLTWNGDVTAEILRSTPTGLKKEIESNASLSYKKLAVSPEFMTFGRDASDGNFLAKFSTDKVKLPLSTESVTVDREPGMLLRIGDKGTVGLLVEVIALPEKAYAVASGKVKNAGVVMAEDSYSDFVQVSNGNWLPTHIVRSNYKLSDQRVPYLAMKREYLAIEPPKVNVTLPAGVFDLADSKEFKSLKLVSPFGQKKRDFGPTTLLDGPAGNRGKGIFITINVALIIVLLAVFVWRRRRRRFSSRSMR